MGQGVRASLKIDLRRITAMRISQAYGAKFGLSYELFPPKTSESEGELFRHLPELMAFEPSFVTCTYGAGGSTRDKTLDIVCRVKREFGCPVASHLTCVGSTADQLRDYLREAQQRDVDNIVALRGDPPKGQSAFTAVAGGFTFANDLVALIHQEFPQFGVAPWVIRNTRGREPRGYLENLRKVDRRRRGDHAVVL
jgi:methylenetetrahydrofolate reductase (NADPH)